MKDAVKEIIEGLRQSQMEALSLAKCDEWVVCFAVDLTPFRSNGTEIRIAGGSIWMTGSSLHARDCAKHLTRQSRKLAKEQGTNSQDVVAMSALEWSTKRVEALGDMIKMLEATSK